MYFVFVRETLKYHKCKIFSSFLPFPSGVRCPVNHVFLPISRKNLDYSQKNFFSSQLLLRALDSSSHLSIDLKKCIKAKAPPHSGLKKSKKCAILECHMTQTGSKTKIKRRFENQLRNKQNNSLFSTAMSCPISINLFSLTKFPF